MQRTLKFTGKQSCLLPLSLWVEAGLLSIREELVLSVGALAM